MSEMLFTSMVCLRPAFAAFVLAASVAIASPAQSEGQATTPEAVASAEGVVRIRSTHNIEETVARVRVAIAAKGVRFFDAIDQQALGAEAGLDVQGSTLILFGNPPLGVQFLQSNRYAGLDWPVRMLVTTEADGSVWLAWTDFHFIATRYHIANLEAQFRMADEVATSIAVDAAN